MDWSKVRSKLNRSADKYRYYFGTYAYTDPTQSKVSNKIPRTRVGWGKRAVDVRANKTHFDCFENDTLKLNDILAKYHVIDALDKLKGDILVCGLGFLALAGDRVMPFTAEEATGTYDWYEQNLKDGVAVFRERTDEAIREREPDSYIKYSNNETDIYQDGAHKHVINITGRPLIGLFTYNSSTSRPFGQSVLSKPARDAMIDASRTIRQANVAAVHYNIKVDVILGADSTSTVDTVEARTGSVLKVGPNENGQIPQIGEFAQHAMAPFTDTVMIAARNFCADTKLSLANLGIDTNAPQSTEALDIVNDDLKDDILDWQQELGEQLKYFAVTLYMYENGIHVIDDNLQAKIKATKPIWLPVYKADVSKFGDGLTKIAQQAPNIIKARSVWRNLGLSSTEIDEIINSANNLNN
ncbi:hypothetical protein IJF85_01470 [Candidatus Saccharibacteria bacterium]|nr:hypothetical protein [Candidatus Saccharibacteria bacterium]